MPKKMGALMRPNDNDIAMDVRRALLEDIGSGDVTSMLLPDNLTVDAVILSREPMLLCGLPWVDAVFRDIDADVQVRWLIDEGSYLSEPSILCEIHGLARSILTAERTALNFLQTLSGTATKTRRYAQLLAGSNTRLLDTRKTLPGLRLAQKYAVFCGGGVNHRFGLYDAFLIKENHIRACGSLSQAIAMARESHRSLFIEVEVETLLELEEALAAKPDRILLDNFSVAMMTEAVAMSRKQQVALEASGGIDSNTIAAVAATGVDYISVGQLTKSVEAIDLSLLIKE